ncbi:hypothetical protein ACTFIZ_002815 [Dictyostelium cf. discoideum]
MSKKITKKDEVEENILNLINKANRPYNYQMVEAAFPSMGKTQIVKTLKSLGEQGKLTFKENNKAIIYWRIQDTGPKLDEQGYEIPQESIHDLNRKLDGINRQLEVEQDTLKSLISQSKQLNNQLSDDQIQKEVDQLSTENKELESKLLTFQTKEIMSDKDKQRLDDTIKKARSEWIKRKALFRDILDQVLERSNKKKKDLQEDIGWETDEDLKIQMIPDYSKPLPQQNLSSTNDESPYKKQKR